MHQIDKQNSKTNKNNSTMEKIHISFIKDLKNKQFFSLFIYLRELLDENKSDNATLNQAGERVKSHHEIGRASCRERV